MARKSKRMALNEAIRRGQAKINEGLKTGQLKSDRPSGKRLETQKSGFLGSESRVQTSVGKIRSFFLKSKEKTGLWGRFSPKVKLITLFCITGIIILILAIWLTSLVKTDQPNLAESIKSKDASIADISPEDENLNTSDSIDPDSPGSANEVMKGSLSTGENVIWIQSIQLSRKEELKPVMDFFRGKGIETEIIELSGSNLAVLMTQQGFDRNPSIKGTEGYRLLERIRQLGSVYVEETQDMKFGKKPFQDVLGYKRQ